MAYQVGSTEVISDSRVLKNITFDPALIPSFGTIIRTVYTSSGTWTPNALDLLVYFQAWGGGVGGRGSIGGGGGGYDERFLWASNLSGPYQVTVGSGGAGSNTPTPVANWQNGGESSITRAATPTTAGTAIVQAYGGYRQYGGQPYHPTTTTAIDPGGFGSATDTYYAGGLGGTTSGQTGGNSLYGGGGGGAINGEGGNIISRNPAQTSQVGNDGAPGGPSFTVSRRGCGGPGIPSDSNGTPGFPWGGGGGGTGAFPRIGGDGAPGAVIITVWRRGL